MLEQACLREEPPPIMEDSQHQAVQAIQAHQAASQQAPITSYQVETLQSVPSATAMPVRTGPYTSAIGSHVPYEPKIEEEDEARD